MQVRGSGLRWRSRWRSRWEGATWGGWRGEGEASSVLMEVEMQWVEGPVEKAVQEKVSYCQTSTVPAVR